MLKGLADRLKSETVRLAPEDYVIRVITRNYHKINVWRGASTLASLPTFDSSWITKEDYEEHGANIVHIKCA